MQAIPEPVQILLDLFKNDLADVRFADMDAKTLAHLASEVRAAESAVMSAQAALDSAKNALQLHQDILTQQAQRALAYARVYAEGNDALSTRLDAVALPRPARRASLVLSATPPDEPARRRGRPRKAANDLPMEELALQQIGGDAPARQDVGVEALE
jgi:hypothetical protein